MLYSSKFDNTHPISYRIAPSSFYTDLNVIEVGHNRVPSGHNQIYRRDVYILHYVINGEGVFCNQKFKKNYCYFVFPKNLEIIKASETHPYETYWIMFKGKKAEEILKKCNIPQHNCVFKFNNATLCSDIIHETLYNIQPTNDIEEAFYLQSAFNKIMSIHFSNADVGTIEYSIAEKVYDYLKNSYASQNTSIEDIAVKLNFSRNYIYTLFKNKYGISPQEFLIKLRLEKAKELIINEKTLSIRDIAFAVGYDDPLYFSRIFHKKVGQSPKEFKNRNAAND